MNLTWDEQKRQKTIIQRDLNFADLKFVFSDTIKIEFKDDRENYGEDRMITVGFLHKRMVVAVWTQREHSRRIISMRKANDREIEKYSQLLNAP